jgi:hypothetical protein
MFAASQRSIDGQIAMQKTTTITENYNRIRAGIVELLKTARAATARNVNSIMTAVYWEIGRRIVETEPAPGPSDASICRSTVRAGFRATS